MKKVFTDRLVTTCDLVKSQLEAAGIMAEVRNERGSMTVGEGLPVFSEPSLAFAWPEVWVNDEDEAAARTIVADAGSGVSDADLEREALNPDPRPPSEP